MRTETHRVRHARPIQLLRWACVVWLAVLAVMSGWRALALWRVRRVLAELESSLSPGWLLFYVALSILCSAGLAGSSLGLACRREWGRRVARVLLTSYFVLGQSYVWLFVRSGLLWERRWVSLVLAVLAVGVGVTALTWRISRRWLGLELEQR